MSTQQRPFFYRETQGMRITVRPLFMPEHSEPLVQRYVFAYLVRIENTSRRTSQLLTRYWRIYDSIGEEHEVRGDGVVGEQPVLAPGDTHEYSSFCVLKSPHGWMEGAYRFINNDDTLFEAQVPRFALDAPDE